MNKKILSTSMCAVILLLNLVSCNGDTQMVSSVSNLVVSSETMTQVSSQPESSDVESGGISSEIEHISSTSSEVDVHHIFMDKDIVGVIPEDLPEYIDGSIELYDQDKQDGTTANRQRRHCFYRYATTLASYIPELGGFSIGNNPKTPLDEWMLEYYGQDSNYFSFDAAEPEDMALVSLIKHFNIPRDVMEKALEDYYNEFYLIEFDEDYVQTEYGELPNLDIVYTLDNNIINEYYRYA